MTEDGWWREPNEYRMHVVRVTFVVFVFAVIVRYVESSVTSKDTVACKVLIQNAERYHAMAVQDGDTAVRLRHSAMAVANLHAARQLFNDSVIESVTGLDVHVTLQRMDAFLHKSVSSCAPPPIALGKTRSPRLPVWP